MKILGSLFVLLAFAAGSAPGASFEHEWFREDLSPEERTALVQQAKNAPLEDVAPVLLRTLNNYQPMFLKSPGGEGPTPWNDEGLPARDRTYYMASMTWRHHMRFRDDPSRAKALLALLQKTLLPAGRSLLIYAMMDAQWCPEAEGVLRETAGSEAEDLWTRASAAKALMRRCGPNAYVPLAVQVVLAHEKGLPRCEAFCRITGPDKRLRALTEENKRALLAAGFAALEDLSEAEARDGRYAGEAAGRLAVIAQRADGFKPDRTAPGYGGWRGPADLVRLETVKNALRWHHENTTEALPITEDGACTARFEREWFREDLSAEERAVLVAEAKAARFDEVAPVLLMALGYRPGGTDGVAGPERVRLRQRGPGYSQASSLWRYHLGFTDDPERAEALLALLKESSWPDERRVLVSAIGGRQWRSEAEAVLRDMAGDAGEDMQVRVACARALMDRCGANACVPLALEVVREHQVGLPRATAFRDIVAFQPGSLTGANRKAALTAGFEVLRELPEEGEDVGSIGVSIVSCLASELRMWRAFEPNRDDPKYRPWDQARYDLDMVKNALRWYDENMAQTPGH